MMILKIGGGAAINLEAVARDVALLNEPVVIVHGAKALRNQLAEDLGTPIKTVTSVSGFTSVYSDDNTIDLMMMAYAGLRNKRLVELLQRNGVNAIGLSGLDGRLVTARRNRGIRAMEGGRKMLMRDLSGKPESLNRDLLDLLLAQGYTPVLTVPVCDEKGYALNTENDEVVALLQRELKADRVVQLIEAPGLLRDVAEPDSLVNQMSAEVLDDWLEQVDGRMKRKVYALRKLFENGRPRVHIGDGRVEEPISALLAGRGTTII